MKTNRIYISSWQPPRICRGGWYFHPANHYGVTYHCPTHCLHQYPYHATIRIGSESFRIRPGDLTFSPAHTDISYSFTQSESHWCIHFYPQTERTKDSLIFPLHFSPGRHAAHISMMLRNLCQCINAPATTAREKRYAQAHAGARLLDFLHTVHHLYRGNAEIPHSAAVERLDGVLNDIEEHIERQDSVATLAARAGVSQNYFSRIFRTRFGMTISQYILQRRMEHAHHLLTTTTIPIKRIGVQVGIPDPQYFNKQFRRIMGQSPSQTRAGAMFSEG